MSSSGLSHTGAPSIKVTHIRLMTSNAKRHIQPWPRPNKTPSMMPSASERKKLDIHANPPQHTPATNSPKPGESGADGEAKTLSLSTSSSDDGDGGIRDSKGAEAEEPGEDDEDGYELAPSACTMKDGKQSGPCIKINTHTLNGINGSRKRRLENSDDDTRYRKVSRKRGREGVTVVDGSDDEDYAGVDLISDSEEEGPGVEQLEGKMIIESIDTEEENGLFEGGSMFPPLQSGSSDEVWEGFDLDDGLLFSDAPFFDDQVSHDDPSVLADEIDMFNSAAFLDNVSLSVFPETRRVRFAEPLVPARQSSFTDASEIVEEHQLSFTDFEPRYPAQGTFLVPSGAESSEFDDEVGSSPFSRQSMLISRSRSKFMSSTKTPTLADASNDILAGSRHDSEQDVDESYNDSCGSSSGYESEPNNLSSLKFSTLIITFLADLGETTEEDELLPSVTARPQSLQRRNSTSMSNAESARTPRPPDSGSRSCGPRLGSWVADPTKPIAFIDRTGKTLIIYPTKPPSKPNKKLATSPTGHSEEHLANSVMTSPISDGRLASPALASPNTFYPFDTFNPGSSIINAHDDDDDDEDTLLNVNDFINFGDDSDDDSELEKDESIPSTIQSTPIKAQSLASMESSPSGFFRDGAVTGFRRGGSAVSKPGPVFV